MNYEGAKERFFDFHPQLNTACGGEGGLGRQVLPAKTQQVEDCSVEQP
jgi:hypothetical protein